jgi:RNA polymerase sigma-70 factor (ECF subfamily)
VVQDTFWSAWRNAASYQPARGSLPAWLCGIARNRAIDIWRRRRGQPAAANDGELEIAPDPRADVAETAWATTRQTRVRAALEVLPEAQRRIIELAYFRGLTRQEIAAATGEPLGTVHTRARLALQKLRDALRGQGLEE